jgi:polysaccharide export outer membrane protein
MSYKNKGRGQNVNIIKGIAAASLITSVGACGVSYNSPSVKKNGPDSHVTVVALSGESAQNANATPYTPRELPAIFYAATNTSTSVTGLGSLPAQPSVPNLQREQPEYIPLPDIQKKPYKIGVGDVLILATTGSSSTVEQLSGLLAAQNKRQGYTVRDDGSISIPGVGDVTLAGLTLQAAGDRLFQTLIQDQIDPTFSLEVAEFNSQRVSVGGAVNKPALVPVTLTPLTLSDALTASGGSALRNKEYAVIRIYRDGRLYQIPFEIYEERPDLQKKLLQDGDAVYLDTSYDLDRALEFYKTQLDVITLRNASRKQTLEAVESEINLRRASIEERRELFRAREILGAVERDYVYLTGEVKKQSRFPLPFGQQASLADVLYEEGGFDNTTGDPSEIYVLRSASKTGPEVIAYHLDATNAVNLTVATKFEMRPDDIVFIEEQPITKWTRALPQIFPTLLNTAGAAALK